MTQALETLDLNDPGLFADGPPHELFARMRAEAPVLWNRPTEINDGFWSITGYADEVAVINDWRTFSSARRGIFLQEEGILPKEFTSFLFSMMDPPDHDKHRAILNKVFTPRAVAAREDDIRAVITTLLDDVIERGECDFVTEVAVRFPLAVTANMLGVPDADRGKLFDWTNKMADVSLPPEQGLAMMQEMAGYLLGLINARREHPTDDLLSRLIQAEVDGEKLNDIEIVAHFAQLMAGGNETTRNAFAGGLLALMDNPDQRRALLEDPSLIPGAVEEILRWHTPIMHNVRTATRDTEIRGVRIEEGQRLALWHVAANRDPDAVADPDVFDVRRSGVKHMSFSGGRHFCLGNQLARLELRIAFEETLHRIPDAQPTGPAARFANNTFHWMTSLPISFTPGAPAGAP
ncbi:MAG TPA: cytochrome P450 [Pseudonocardia sp.]|nr:cytochrome P450 [Pseudonocardia sp.]